MKLVSFHLMPYRPLDLVEAAKRRSPWVVLPNRLYDPVKGAEEYAHHIASKREWCIPKHRQMVRR